MESKSLIELPALNFPQKYPFRLKKDENKLWIFSEIRKKWLVLTPEEWVRQHVIQYLNKDKNYPLHILKPEKLVNINGLKQRADLLVYKKEKPLILVECKKPSVTITQETWNQVMRYNVELQTPYLLLTNGINHYYASFDSDKKVYFFIENLPDYR